MRSICLVILVLLLTGTSFARNAYWKDDTTIWSDTIARSPRKSRAYNELGLGLIARGEYEQAYALLVRSLQLDPYQGPIYINLGLAFEHLNRVEDAIRTYEKAAWVQPNDPTAYYNLGVLHYSTLNDRDRALGYFLKARDLDPLEPDAHQYLSFIYEARGDHIRARQERTLYEQLRHR